MFMTFNRVLFPLQLQYIVEIINMAFFYFFMMLSLIVFNRCISYFIEHYMEIDGYIEGA